MKQRCFLFLIAMLVTASMATAQNYDKRMAQIRKAYADRMEMMNNKPYDSKICNEISVDVGQDLPGSGLYERHDKYYFTPEQYPEDGTSQLYFVTSKETYAMGTHIFYWEFLWDSENGDPMFAYLVRQEGKSKKEYRFYFENGKVIKTSPELKQWPDKDMMSLHPYVIDAPADVLKIMKKHVAKFKSLLCD